MDSAFRVNSSGWRLCRKWQYNYVLFRVARCIFHHAWASPKPPTWSKYSKCSASLVTKTWQWCRQDLTLKCPPNQNVKGLVRWATGRRWRHKEGMPSKRFFKELLSPPHLRQDVIQSPWLMRYSPRLALNSGQSFRLSLPQAGIPEAPCYNRLVSEHTAFPFLPFLPFVFAGDRSQPTTVWFAHAQVQASNSLTT